MNKKLEEIIGLVEYEYRNKREYSNHQFVRALAAAVEHNFVLKQRPPRKEPTVTLDQIKDEYEKDFGQCE